MLRTFGLLGVLVLSSGCVSRYGVGYRGHHPCPPPINSRRVIVVDDGCKPVPYEDVWVEREVRVDPPRRRPTPDVHVCDEHCHHTPERVHGVVIQDPPRPRYTPDPGPDVVIVVDRGTPPVPCEDASLPPRGEPVVVQEPPTPWHKTQGLPPGHEKHGLPPGFEKNGPPPGHSKEPAPPVSSERGTPPSVEESAPPGGERPVKGKKNKKKSGKKEKDEPAPKKAGSEKDRGHDDDD